LQIDPTDPRYVNARSAVDQVRASLASGTPGTYLVASTQTYTVYKNGQAIGELGLRYAGPLDTGGGDGWISLTHPDIAPTWWQIRKFQVDGTRITGTGEGTTEQSEFWGWIEGTITPDGSQISNLSVVTEAYLFQTAQWCNTNDTGLSGQRTSTVPITMQIDPNPLLAGSVCLRDMLPQFGSDGKPIPGTMGHGLSNDPTLGGVFPGMTQQGWIPWGYEVWGGDTDYRSAPGSWTIFYNIDKHGYTKLGASDGGNLTVSGHYTYYVIVARGNFWLDAIQGSDGAYYNGSPTTGNTSDWSNVTGAPDGQYARVGEPRFFTLGGDTFSGYVVVANPGGWTGLTVIATAAAPSPGTETIGGAVYTDLANPLSSGIAGVRITATGTGGTFTATTAGAQGLWQIDQVPAGTYTVTPSRSGKTFAHVTGSASDGHTSIQITVDADHRAANQSIQFLALPASVLLHDWNGDGIISIIGDVPCFVQCVYFGNCPP
jgi:hypothetical protein